MSSCIYWCCNAFAIASSEEIEFVVVNLDLFGACFVSLDALRAAFLGDFRALEAALGGDFRALTAAAAGVPLHEFAPTEVLFTPLCRDNWKKSAIAFTHSYFLAPDLGIIKPSVVFRAFETAFNCLRLSRVRSKLPSPSTNDDEDDDDEKPFWFKMLTTRLAEFENKVLLCGDNNEATLTEEVPTAGIVVPTARLFASILSVLPTTTAFNENMCNISFKDSIFSRALALRSSEMLETGDGRWLGLWLIVDCVKCELLTNMLARLLQGGLTFALLTYLLRYSSKLPTYKYHRKEQGGQILTLDCIS